MTVDNLGRNSKGDSRQAKLSVLLRGLRDYAGSGDGSGETRASDIVQLAKSRHNYLLVSDDGDVSGGLFVEDGNCFVWGVNNRRIKEPVTLKLVADGKTLFEKTTTPANDQYTLPTNLQLSKHRIMTLFVGQAQVSTQGFKGQVFWKSPAEREDLTNFVKSLPESTAEARQRHAIWRSLPNTVARLEKSDEPQLRGRPSVYTRYMADRLEVKGKLAGGTSIANWIVSDVFEDWFKRQVFCLTDELLALLSEPVMNRRVMKNDISLTLFAFWRRHYQHIDIFTDEGLRLVQYRFATAPFINDKNNYKLVSDSMRKSLSNPAEQYRNHELPWSWYWMFLLDDQGQGERMRDEAFVRTTTFKEVALDITQPDRLSFNPVTWRAYWGAGANAGFTRFDLALISLLADTPIPDQAVAEFGEEYWRERLRNEVYAISPDLSALSAAGPVETNVEVDIPTRDLVLIGYANETGVGRNLTMFREATAAYDPLIFSADDGTCVNPDPSYNPAVGVRARTVILCVNADRAPEMLARFSGVCEGAHVIGFYLWESDRPPSNHTLGANVVDEIWCPTNYVADAYRKITSVPVEVIDKGLRTPLPYAPFLDRFREDPSDFIFLTAGEFGSSIVRKNPLDVVKAFQKAFQDSDLPVKLILKVREINPGHWSNIDSYWEEIEERIAGDDRISILEGTLTVEEYWSLLWTSDAMVSLHRSEGFGYVIADAMFAEKAVIVSDYSGSQDFCNEDTAFLVPVTLSPTPAESLASKGYVGQWGTPDVDEAARQMRDAVENADLRKARAKAGSVLVHDKYDFERWSDAISARIRETLKATQDGAKRVEESSSPIQTPH